MVNRETHVDEVTEKAEQHNGSADESTVTVHALYAETLETNDGVRFLRAGRLDGARHWDGGGGGRGWGGGEGRGGGGRLCVLIRHHFVWISVLLSILKIEGIMIFNIRSNCGIITSKITYSIYLITLFCTTRFKSKHFK